MKGLHSSKLVDRHGHPDARGTHTQATSTPLNQRGQNRNVVRSRNTSGGVSTGRMDGRTVGPADCLGFCQQVARFEQEFWPNDGTVQTCGTTWWQLTAVYLWFPCTNYPNTTRYVLVNIFIYFYFVLYIRRHWVIQQVYQLNTNSH
jgi:hypothetical protein